jgi:hypothetical protein
MLPGNPVFGIDAFPIRRTASLQRPLDGIEVNP